MAKTIDIYYDYVCPYCYIASRREGVLKKDLKVEFDWKPWEIHPERPIPCDTREDLTCSTFIEKLAAEVGLEISMPVHYSNSHIALLGALIAKKKGKFDSYHQAMFKIHWEEKKDIAEISVLREVCRRIGLDPDEFQRELAKPEHESSLNRIDKEAERIRVQLVPSYVLGRRIVVGNISLAELRKELERYLRSQ